MPPDLSRSSRVSRSNSALHECESVPLGTGGRGYASSRKMFYIANQGAGRQVNHSINPFLQLFSTLPHSLLFKRPYLNILLIGQLNPGHDHFPLLLTDCSLWRWGGLLQLVRCSFRCLMRLFILWSFSQGTADALTVG